MGAGRIPPFDFLFHRHAEQVAPLAPEFEQVVEVFQKLAVLKPLVAEELADVGVVFLLHVGLVVLEVGARAGLVDAVFFQPVAKLIVQELIRYAHPVGACRVRSCPSPLRSDSPPLSLSTPSRSKGWLSQMDWSASKLACCPRFHTARSSVQPLEISTLVSVQMKSPPMSPPHWATVSTSVQPVSVVSQLWARTSTRALTALAGLGGRIFFPAVILKPRSNRSILAALIFHSWSRISSEQSRCFDQSGSMSFMRFPQGCSMASQQVLRILVRSAPYFRGAPRFPRRPLLRRLPRSTLLTCLRSQPVIAMNSSSRRPRALRPFSRRYLARIFFVYSSMLVSLMPMAGAMVSPFMRQRDCL